MNCVARVFIRSSLIAFLGLSLSSAAQAACPAPYPDASSLFQFITNPQAKVADVNQFVSAHTVGWDALNENCDNIITASITRKRNDLFAALYEHYIPDPNSASLGDESSRASIGVKVLQKGDANTLKILADEMVAHQQGALTVSALFANHGTALMIAAESNPLPEVVSALLKMGTAAVNAQDSRGENALFYAARNSNPDVLRTLLQAGADTRQMDVSGRNPLASAASNPNPKFARILIRAGAPINNSDRTGWTVLDIAALAGNVTVAQILIQAGATVNHRTNEGYTVLMEAADGGNVSMAQLLIQSGANVNDETAQGDALTIATKGGHIEMAQYLKKMGATLGKNQGKLGALTYDAISAGDVQNVSLLLEFGLNPEILLRSNGLTFSPLTFAVDYGQLEIVRVLIQYGANVNDTLGGCTVLMYALAPERGGPLAEVVELLLNAGANPNIKNNDGKTAYQYGKAHEVPKQILKLLK